MAATSGFRRLVLILGHGEAGPATLRHAAELARLLRLGLHCVLIEDEALFQLPALPFARELRLPTHEWRPLNADRIAEDFAAMAEGLRRSLATLGTSLGIAQALEVQRGDPAFCLGALCIPGDIIVLAEDAQHRPRPHPSALLHDAARHSAASVLLLPPGPTDLNAPVVVLLAGPDDPSLAIAAGIAVNAGAPLLAVLAAGDPAVVAQRAAALGLPPARLIIRQAAGRGMAAIDAVLGATPARLLVLDQAAWGFADAEDLAAALARRRGAPVLIMAGPDHGGS